MSQIHQESVVTKASPDLVRRLFSFMLPYTKQMVLCLVLVLCISGLDLLRPMIIADAIDSYIEGYNTPYYQVEDSWVKDEEMVQGANYGLLVLYEDQYYWFTELSKDEVILLQESDVSSFTLDNNTLSLDALKGNVLTAEELKELRSSDISGVVRNAIVYVIVLVILVGLNVAQTWILQLTGQNIIYGIRNQMMEKVHSLHLRYFDTHPVGQIVTRITNDVETLHEMYANILVRLFRNVVRIIGLAFVMISLNLRLALYSFILLPFIGILTYIFRVTSRKMYRIVRVKVSQMNTFLSENISGMKIIQMFAKEDFKFNEFHDRNVDLFKSQWKELMVFAIFRPLIYMLSVIALSIVIYNGSVEVLAGTITIGTLYIFINYINQFFEPIQELAEQFSTLQNAFASAEKIFTILDEESPIKECENPIELTNPIGKIEFKNVWFAYDDENFVLRDVSFVIESGQSVAFVGATGAGKSSILNLIGRYYDIQKGQILIDGIDIKQLSVKSLRSAIGQVQQDVFVFTGDMYSNIRLLDSSISDEEVHEAARLVNASYFIEQLPNGYSEEVSERGSTLSSGQRQLLSFARTIAFKPKILVMDEATANIDTETEGLIQDGLKSLMDSRTTIMVAHRLSTIQHADKIIVMHKGKIRESGTHQELLALDGIYKKLYELQLHS